MSIFEPKADNGAAYAAAAMAADAGSTFSGIRAFLGVSLTSSQRLRR